MQKIIFCSPKDSEAPDVDFRDVNDYLEEEYKIVSITPQSCAVTSGEGYAKARYAGFAVVIEKEDIIPDLGPR